MTADLARPRVPVYQMRPYTRLKTFFSYLLLLLRSKFPFPSLSSRTSATPPTKPYTSPPWQPPPTAAPPPSQFDLLRGIIHTTNLILSSHARHFLSLATLFLLPFSSLLLTLLPSSFPHRFPPSLLRSPPLPSPLYLLLLPLFLLLALTAVSLSVNQGFFGRPVKLLSTLISLPLPFLRLLLTFLTSLLLLSTLLIGIAAVIYLTPYPRASPFLTYLAFGAITAIYITLAFTSWSLSGPISVLEPSAGYPPLDRSTELITGMRWASLSLFLFFASAISMTIFAFSVGMADWREAFPMVVKMVLGSGVMVVLLLYWSIANAVMYMYCKGLHGELAGEIAEEFAAEYVSLPFDDNKMPHVVSVIRV